METVWNRCYDNKNRRQNTIQCVLEYYNIDKTISKKKTNVLFACLDVCYFIVTHYHLDPKLIYASAYFLKYSKIKTIRNEYCMLSFRHDVFHDLFSLIIH